MKTDLESDACVLISGVGVGVRGGGGWGEIDAGFTSVFEGFSLQRFFKETNSD